MYKTVIIPTSFKGKEVPMGLLQAPKMVEWKGHVDGQSLSKEIEAVCNLLESDGYQVISVTPITNGYLAGVNEGGYGYTAGVVILFHK